MEQWLPSDWLNSACEASDWLRSDPVRWSMWRESWANLISSLSNIIYIWEWAWDVVIFHRVVKTLWHQGKSGFVLADILSVCLLWLWVSPEQTDRDIEHPLQKCRNIKWSVSMNICFRNLAVIAFWLIINLPRYYKNDQMTTIISPFYPWLCWNLKNSLPRSML